MTTPSTTGDDTPRIVDVLANLMLDGPTDDAASLLRIFATLGEDTLLTPTHGSTDDRKRLPFDAATLAAEAEQFGPIAWLWGTRRPKFVGAVDATNQLIARMSIDFERIKSADVAPVCTEIAELVDRLRPAFASLGFRWSEPHPEDYSDSLRGIKSKAREFRKGGPAGVYAWTWFGPSLVEQLTMETLEAAGATPTSWGGAWLALDEEPWSLEYADLRTRQVAATELLRPAGVFGDYRVLANPTPGPNWVPVPNVSAP